MFSVDRLVALPFADATSMIDEYLASTANGVTILPTDATAIIRDLHVILDRCVGRADTHLRNNIKNAAPNVADAVAASQAMSAYLRLVQAAGASPSATEHLLLQRRIMDDEANCLKRLRTLLVNHISDDGCNVHSLSAAPRQAALSLVYSVADSADCKSAIAATLFDVLFHFIASRPNNGAASTHAATFGVLGDDDYTARRTAGHIITSTVRGSTAAKNLIISKGMLAQLTPAIRDTPTGDFFLQLQCIEIVYRVSRAQLSVLDTLGLPDMIFTALKSNKLPSDNTFISHLIKLLDTYNTSRQAAHLQVMRAQQERSVAAAAGNSTDATSNTNPQEVFENGVPSPLFSFRVSSFSIEVEFPSDDKESGASKDDASSSNGGNGGSSNSKKVTLRSTRDDTTVIFSPRLMVLLLPQAHGLNITQPLLSLTTLKISRDSVVRTVFRTPPREQLMLMIDTEAALTAGAADHAVIDAIEQRQLPLLLNLSFDQQVCGQVRACPLQQWVIAALERKKLAKQMMQQQQGQNKHNAAGAAISSRPQSRATSLGLQQQQQQQAAPSSSATAAVFGAPRDPNAVATNTKVNNVLNVHADSSRHTSGCRNEDDATAMPSRFSGGDVPPIAGAGGAQQQQQQRRPPTSSTVRFDDLDINQFLGGNNMNPATNNKQQPRLLETEQPRVSAGFSSLFGGLRSMIGNQINQKRNETAQMLQETVRVIQRRVEEEREKGRRERDELELFLQSELEALRAAENEMKSRASKQVTLLNEELFALDKDAREVRTELEAIKAELTAADDRVAELHRDSMMQLKTQVETSLQRIAKVIVDMSAETVLPQHFLSHIAHEDTAVPAAASGKRGRK